MNIALLASKQDTASMSQQKALLDFYDWRWEGEVAKRKHGDHHVSLYTFEEGHVHHEEVDQKVDADLIVFLSKHQSKSGIPSLSVHAIGNFASADFGGRDNTLVACHAELMYLIYQEFLKHETDYEKVYEATHHGPYIQTPCLFLEVGSAQKQWEDEEAAKIVVFSLMHALLRLGQIHPPSVIGLGGLHTTPNFNKLVARKQIMLGHVCPVYNLENLSSEMIEQMIKATVPEPEMIVVDWKGLKQHKEHVKKILESASLPIKRIKEFKQP